MSIPTSDFYSQLKSLEGKSDAERRRLVWQAVVKRGDAIWVIPGLVALAAAVAWFVLGWQLMIIVNAAAGGGAAAPAGIAAVSPSAAASGGTPYVLTPLPGSPAAAARSTLPPALKSLLFGLGVIVYLAAWVVTRRIMVIRTLRRLLNRVVCPACDFSLVGLQARGSIVICPECGERVDLYKNGLKPDDLLTERQKRRPLPGAGRYGAYAVPEPKKARVAK